MQIPITTFVNPFHVEIILVPPNRKFFEKHIMGKKVGGIKLSQIGDFEYTDTFYDTPSFDLHSNSITLRFREAEGKNSVLGFKGSPSYVHQMFVARKYSSQKLPSTLSVIPFLKMEQPSEPLQFLYQERPDIVGIPLKKAAAARVKIEAMRFGRMELWVLFHSFDLEWEGGKARNQCVVEIQPTEVSATDLISHLGDFAEVLATFIADDYRLSPCGKYQRVSRRDLENA